MTKRKKLKKICYICWVLIWCIPTYIALFIFCILAAVINLEIEIAVDTWKENL